MLVDPDWFALVETLADCERSELLLAILEYPNRPCKLPAWNFIRKQLDKDAIKYHAKCACLAENKRAHRMSEQISADIRQNSGAIAIEQSKDQYQDNDKEQSKGRRERAGDIITGLSKSFSPNKTVKFTIDNNFSIAEIITRNPAWAELFRDFSCDQMEAGQGSLIKKCFGQQKTLQQIIGWINQEGKYPGNK